MRKTKYLIIGILLLVSIPLILVNCQKETFDEVPQTGITVKKISFEDLKQKKQLAKKIDAIKKAFDVNQLEKSNIVSNDGSFTILTDEILQTIMGVDTTYTMRIEMPTDSTATFENFVIRPADSTYLFSIFRFYFDETQDSDFPYTLSALPVNASLINSGEFDNLLKQTIWVEDCMFDLYCEIELLNPCCDCLQWVLEQVCCGSDCDGGGNGSVEDPDPNEGEDEGGESDPNNGEGDGEGSGSGSGDPYSSGNVPGGVGVLQPIPAPHCEELNNTINSEGANIKPHLENLKTKLQEEGENGVSLQNDGGTYNNVTIPPTNTNTITPPVGNAVYGAAHMHPAYSTFPMFSWGDVYTLSKLYQYTSSDLKDEVTFMLVCADIPQPAEVYALVIDDAAAFFLSLNNELQNMINNNPSIDSSLPIADKIELAIGFLNDDLGNEFIVDADFEKAFLNYFGDYNISLFKADGAISNWSKLSLDSPIGPVEETPCN